MKLVILLVATASLGLHAIACLGANGPATGYHLREIFVPQKSEFTQQHAGGVSSFDFSPDGKTLAVEFGTQEPGTTSGKCVAVWDVDGQRLIGTRQVDSNIPFLAWYTSKIRFSPDGRKLIVLTGPRLVALSFPELKVLYTFENRVLPEDAPNQMFIEGFSIASNRLGILRQYDHTSGHTPLLELKMVDLDSGEVLARWNWPRNSYSIALSPDANFLALAINPDRWGYRDIPTGENNVFIVRPNSGEVVRGFNSGYAASNAEFVGGDKTLVTVPLNSHLGPDDAVKLWDRDTGEIELNLDYPKYGLRGAISVSADGNLLAIADFWLNFKDIRLDRDNTRGGARLLLWSLPAGKLIYSSEELGQQYNFGALPMGFSWGGMTPPMLVRMSASGDRLAVGGEFISVKSIVKD
ncbi:MAG TPA: WD40 repeat domain-containing protein [Blastocatellia bacterium]|nr:WD40 repeat domain-containing protein [Blastocatellia bacterium]